MQQATIVSISVNHTQLTRTAAELIQAFLSVYDQYSKEVTACATQLFTSGGTSSEAEHPVNIKFHTDHEDLESTIALNSIKERRRPSTLVLSPVKIYGTCNSQQKSRTIGLSSQAKFAQINREEGTLDQNDRREPSFLHRKPLHFLQKIAPPQWFVVSDCTEPQSVCIPRPWSNSKQSSTGRFAIGPRSS